MKQNILPKSLRTVTVLVAVARAIPVTCPIGELGGRGETDKRVTNALRVLGYADTTDTYELAAKARAILAKSVQS